MVDFDGVVFVCRSDLEWRQRASVPAALPHAAAPLARVQGVERRRVGQRLPAGCGAGGQASVASPAPPPAPLVLFPPDAAEGLNARLCGGGCAWSAGLPGRRRARYRHERRLHATAAGAAIVWRCQAHDGRAAIQAA